MKTQLKATSIALALFVLPARGQAPDPNTIASYKKEFDVVGRLRIAGSELKGNVDLLVEGFKKFQPNAKISTNFMTSSEGALGMMYAGVSDVATMGGYDKRGVLFAWAIIVNKDNPITSLSMDQLDRIFGSERTGGWEVGDGADHNLLFTAKYARGPDTNLRKWSQLGLKGEWTNKDIQTYGYVAPGFATNFQRLVMHWTIKWNPNFKEYVEAKEATNDATGRAVSSQRIYEALEKDRYGIGWGALMHVNGTCVNPDGSKCPGYRGLKVLALSRAAGAPAVALTADNVANRSYPLVRDAYIYVDKPPGRPMDPRVREFLRFILSREGQQIIAKNGPYSPIPADYIRVQLKKLD